MATLIYVDKENGEPGTRVAPKDGLKLGSGPCKYTGGNQVHRYCESVVGVAWSWGRHLVYFASNWSQVYPILLLPGSCYGSLFHVQYLNEII